MSLNVNGLTPDEIKRKEVLNGTASLFSSETQSIDASIFVGATKEEFVELMTQKNSIFSQNKSLASASEYDSDGSMLKASAEAYFDSLDKNGDGTLQDTEVASVSGLDNDASTFSASEIKNMLASWAEKAWSAIFDKESQAAYNAVVDDVPGGNPTAGTSSGANGSSGFGAPGSVSKPTNVSKMDTANADLEELEKQKQDTITGYDGKISTKEEDKDKLVEDSDKVSDELKEKYSDCRSDITEMDSQISDNKSQIDTISGNIDDVDNTLAQLQGELGALDTSTDDEETNKANAARQSEIQSQISQNESKKSDLEKEKADLEDKNKQLEENKSLKEKDLSQIEAEIQKQDPGLKQKMTKINTELDQLKNEKTEKVQDLDTQIASKRTEKQELSKKAGELIGKMQSNTTGEGIADLALSFLGVINSDAQGNAEFSGGVDEAWCADFVTGIVKRYCDQNGVDMPSGFGSPAVSNLQQQAMDAGYFETGSDYQPKPGDVIVWKNANESHVAFVASINDDGSIQTIEGNWGDKVASRTVKETGKSSRESAAGYINLSDWLKAQNS